MSIKDIVLIALFASITAALGVFPPITMPIISVPITAQSLGIMLAGGILGAKRGSLAIILFLILVAIGLPLLSGGRGGIGIFIGPTGGFLFGWIIAAYAIGFMVERYWVKINYISAFLSCAIGGIILLYIIGIPWVAFVAKIPLMAAITGSIAFIPGDIIKAVIASAVIITVAKSYPIINKDND